MIQSIVKLSKKDKRSVTPNVLNLIVVINKIYHWNFDKHKSVSKMRLSVSDDQFSKRKKGLKKLHTVKVQLINLIFSPFRKRRWLKLYSQFV